MRILFFKGGAWYVSPRRDSTMEVVPVYVYDALEETSRGAFKLKERNCFSEVIHDPRLVRVQVGLDDCSQLVVVTLKLLRVHQQMVSQFLWAFPQHHADLHVIVQLC